MGLRFPRLAFSPSHLTDHPVALPDPPLCSCISPPPRHSVPFTWLRGPSSRAHGHLSIPPSAFLPAPSLLSALSPGGLERELWLETCRVHVHLCCRHAPRGPGHLPPPGGSLLSRQRRSQRVSMCTCRSGRTALYPALALVGCVSLAGDLTSRVTSASKASSFHGSTI